jgi:hypothetical protein
VTVGGTTTIDGGEAVSANPLLVSPYAAAGTTVSDDKTMRKASTNAMKRLAFEFFIIYLLSNPLIPKADLKI